MNIDTHTFGPITRAEHLDALIQRALGEYHLPPTSDDYDPALLAGDSLQYVLLERGHYGETYVSTHDTGAAAADYTINQEYAEDWSAEVLIDIDTGEFLEPLAIVWGAR